MHIEAILHLRCHSKTILEDKLTPLIAFCIRGNYLADLCFPTDGTVFLREGLHCLIAIVQFEQAKTIMPLVVVVDIFEAVEGGLLTVEVRLSLLVEG